MGLTTRSTKSRLWPLCALVIRGLLSLSRVVRRCKAFLCTSRLVYLALASCLLVLYSHFIRLAYNNATTIISPSTLFWQQRDSNIAAQPINKPLFHYSRGPIFSAIPSSPVRIRVLLFEHVKRPIIFRPGPTGAISDEVLHIVMDGADRSAYFELLDPVLVPDFTIEPNFVIEEARDVVWVVDMRRIVYKVDYTIPEQVLHALNNTRQYQLQHKTSDSSYIVPDIRIVLMDFRDRLPNFDFCVPAHKDIIDMIGHDNLRMVVQQTVRFRDWSPGLNFVKQGSLIKPKLGRTCFPPDSYPILQCPYTVRSDIVETVSKLYSLHLSRRDTSTRATPVDTVRDLDIAHFWTVQNDPSQRAYLRDTVSNVVASLNGTRIGDQNIHTLASLVSTPFAQGRIDVAVVYATNLLTTKIIVVAQRDGWEDHFRLFEAIAGGALVMTDPMLTLPEGLVHGENILIYRNLTHLRDLLLYYVNDRNRQERMKIARNGWELAMRSHRSYHWLEKLFLGKILTP
jgi:Glycosyl transferases group 1